MANEVRLIDANALWTALDEAGLFANGNPRHMAQQTVEEQPTVDAVEVVRCKDCKYGEPSVNAIGESSCCCNNPDIGFYEWLLDEDDFCSYGERKDNERKAD